MSEIPLMIDRMAEEDERPLLGEYLLARNLVNKEALDAALMEQKVTGERLGRILVRNGFLMQADLIKALEEVSAHSIVEEQHFSFAVPVEVLIDYQVIVSAESEDAVYLSTLQDEKVVARAIQPHYPNKTLRFTPLRMDHMDVFMERLSVIASGDEGLLESLIHRSLRENASDIHIFPREASYSVLFRIDGVRKLVHEGSLEEYNTLIARIKDKARMDIAERRVPQDGGFSLEHDNKLVDLRIATVPSVSGEAVVIRLLDPDRVQPNLDTLGISDLSAWRNGINRKNGISLICGPTGSGKTTTLNATIRTLDRFGKAIFSIEDPVEYRLPYTGQVNANPAVGLDFARGLKSFMRSDPDIILLGEIRDLETAQNAIKAGETGHLVLATLHTNNIRGTFERLRDIGIDIHELRYLVRSILVQNLIRKVCTHCHGEGCERCSHTGYRGRQIISEVVYFETPEDVDRVINGESFWLPMVCQAIQLMEEGLTDEAELIRVFGEAEYRRSQTKVCPEARAQLKQSRER